MPTLYDELKQVQANLRHEADLTLVHAVRFVPKFRAYFAAYLGCREDQIAINLPYKAPYQSTLLEGAHTIIPVGLDFMRFTNRINLGVQRTSEGHLRYRLWPHQAPSVIRVEHGEPREQDLHQLCRELETFLRERLERTRLGAGQPPHPETR